MIIHLYCANLAMVFKLWRSIINLAIKKRFFGRPKPVHPGCMNYKRSHAVRLSRGGFRRTQTFHCFLSSTHLNCMSFVTKNCGRTKNCITDGRTEVVKNPFDHSPVGTDRYSLHLGRINAI